MKLYKLSISYDRRKASDIYQPPPSYDFFAPSHPRNIPIDKFPEKEIDFFDIIVNPVGILSDFINTGTLLGGLGFLISPRAKDIFDGFKLPPHHYYFPVTVRKGDAVHYYYRIHILYEDFHHFINFKRSTFTWEKTDGTAIIIEFTDKGLYLEKLKASPNGERIILKDIVLEKWVERERDLLFYAEHNFSCIVSEALKNEIVRESISGLKDMELIDWISI